MAVAADRMTDLRLVAAAAKANRLATCYQQMDASLRAWLIRETRSVDDAEDLAQEAFLRLWRTTEWDRIRSIEAFIYKTAINLVRDRSRRAYTRMMLTAVPVSDVAIQDTSGEPDRVMEALQTLGTLSEVVAQLHPHTRRAFVLHKIANHSHAAVARKMRISVSMVEKHIGRACKALRAAGLESQSV